MLATRVATKFLKSGKYDKKTCLHHVKNVIEQQLADGDMRINELYTAHNEYYTVLESLKDDVSIGAPKEVGDAYNALINLYKQMLKQLDSSRHQLLASQKQIEAAVSNLKKALLSAKY